MGNKLCVTRCGLLVAVLAVAWSVPTASAQKVSPPNVLLITLDTVRADHLGCYGYKSIRTPNIDGLAADGVRFEKIYTPVPATLPAHVALFTSSYPMVTGMHDFSGNRLNSSQLTLASALRREAYATAAIIGAAVLDSRFGVDNGFDFYYDNFESSQPDKGGPLVIERRGDAVVDEALDWLEKNRQRRFFLWVHLYDAHDPYEPPPPFAAEYRKQPYDGEIAFADAQVGRVLAYLKEKNLYDNTLVVLTSDHGEGLGEHGESKHGFFIYTSTLHVPLILKLPAGRAVPRKVVAVPASLIDIFPTVLQLAGLPLPGSLQGKSLLPLMLGRAQEPHAGLYAETFLPRLHFNWSELRSIRVGDYHFIEAPRPELYNLAKDPGELNNLFGKEKARGEKLQSQLAALVQDYTPEAGSAVAEEMELDPALAERLKSLGYVAVSGAGDATVPGSSLADPKDRLEMYELVAEAVDDSQYGRYRESTRKLLSTFKWEKNSTAVRYLLGLNYYRMQEYPKAVEEFRETLRLQPGYALAAFYLGLAYGRAGDWDQAISALKRALALDPTSAASAFNLGAAYLQQKKVREAEAAFRQAVEINPGYVQAQEMLGKVLLYQNRVDEALPALRTAVKLDPNNASGYRLLAQALEAQGLHQEAEEALKKAQSLTQQR